MAKLVMQDVADCVVIDKQTGKTAIYAQLQLSGLEGSISEEDLRAGIGNGRIFKIRTDKALDLNLRSATVDLEWLAMQQGVEVEEGKTARVTKIETVEAAAVSGTPGSFKVTITGTPINNTVRITNVEGEQEVATFTTGSISLPSNFVSAAGDKVTVSYYEEVTGNRIQFDASKFSKKYRVELHTIAYSLETAEVYSDIYFVFDEAMPSGDFSFNLESGSVITPEVTFAILAPQGSTVMGELIEVPRT